MSPQTPRRRTILAAREFRLLTGLAVVGSLAAGCAGIDRAPPSETGLFPGAESLPLDTMMFGDPDVDPMIDRAIRSIASQCLAERGFLDVELPARVAPEIPGGSPFGPVDAEIAAVSGYRPSPVWSTEPPTSAEWNQEPPPELIEALLGTLEAVPGSPPRPDACWAQGIEAITPNWEEEERLMSELTPVYAASFEDLDSNPRVSAAWAEWSECMAQQGMSFDTPLDPLRSVWAASGPDDHELEVARADAECKQQPGVLSEWSREVARIQETLLQGRTDSLERWEKLRRDSLAAARAHVELSAPGIGQS